MRRVELTFLRGVMDSQFKNKLMSIGAVLTALVVLYFIVSPYQNCMRDSPDRLRVDGVIFSKVAFCVSETAW